MYNFLLLKCGINRGFHQPIVMRIAKYNSKKHRELGTYISFFPEHGSTMHYLERGGRGGGGAFIQRKDH